MNTDILPLLQPILKRFTIAQRNLATQFLSDKRYSLGKSGTNLVIRDLDGQVYSFYEFIKLKCNCG